MYSETSGSIDIDGGGLNGTSELIGSLTAVPRMDEVNDYQVVANHSSVSTCPFFGETTNKLVVWAYQAPVLLLLACNMVFLIYIMTVSITKYLTSYRVLLLFLLTAKKNLCIFTSDEKL